MKFIAKILLLTSMAISIVACSSSDNLANPAELVDFSPTIKVEKVWGHNTGTAGTQYLNLQIGHDAKNVYVANGRGEVQAMNANSGKRLWTTKLDTSVKSGVAVGHNLVVVGNTKGTIYAMAANNGNVLWHVNVGNTVLAPAGISSQAVIVKTVADDVMALDPATGKTLWQFTGNAPTLLLRGGSQPQVSGNLVAVGFASGKLGVFSIDKGLPIWQQAVAQPQGSFPIQRMVDITAAPVISNGVIYTASYQGNIMAFNLTNGQKSWNHKLSSYTGLASSGDSLYVTDADSYVWSFQKSDGGVSWRQKQLSARDITAPAVQGQYVVVGDSDGYVHWLAMNDGHFVGRVRLSTIAIQSAPVVVGNMVFVMDVAGHLIGYRVS
jgi:outer membrane protein assembly factor BamB